VLEEHLGARGYAIFVDRHLPVGVEWAREIEHQVRTADAVVPILSPSSVESEILAHEVQIAHDAALGQSGIPRLLPVRIGDTWPLPPGPLAAVLEPLVYALWRGPEDDRGLVEEVLRSLEGPRSDHLAALGGAPPGSRFRTLPAGSREPGAGSQNRARLEPAGGAVPLDSQFYVVRDTDHEFHEAIARGDSTVLVKGARQMGKTSLLGRGLDQARRAGARVLFTDFQQMGAAHLASAELFFQALGAAIADQLELESTPDQSWDPRLGPSMNFNRYVRRDVLGRITQPIVWGMDEVEHLAACDFGGEVFGLLRSWHNQRVTDPTAPWTRLTLAIAYATEVHLFITNVNQSPFNVGTRLTLADFTPEHVADLNARHGAPLRNPEELERFYRLVGGQPYLVRRGLYEMSARGLSVGLLEEQADGEEGIFGDHLRRLLVVLARNPELLDVMRGVLRGEPCPSADSYYRLRSAGILSGDAASEARLRCPIYGRYLARHLLGTA
jgi:hypothetical protein